MQIEGDGAAQLLLGTIALHAYIMLFNLRIDKSVVWPGVKIS